MNAAIPPKGPEPTYVPTYVDLRGLTRVGAKLPFGAYLAALWNYRHFIFFDAKSNVQTRNSSDKLGSVWLVLTPLMNGLTYFLIFGVLLRASRGMENYIGYLLIGVFLFQISSRSIATGARAIRSNLKVVQAFNFPRAALLFGINMRETLANVPAILTMLVLLLLIQPSEPITWMWLLIFPALLLQMIFNLGVGLILARLVARFNDLANFIGFATRIWLYGSCVMFPITLFDRFPVIRGMIEFNPLYQVLTIVRNAVLYYQLPRWESWAILTAWAFGALIIGMLYFWQAEESYGRDE